MNLPIRTAYQGDTVFIDFDIVEPDGSRLDLTGTTVKWSMSDPDNLNSPLLTKTSPTSITLLSPTNGVCRVVIDAGDLATPGTYVQEIEVEQTTGVTYTYGQGPLVVKPTVIPT